MESNHRVCGSKKLFLLVLGFLLFLCCCWLFGCFLYYTSSFRNTIPDQSFHKFISSAPPFRSDWKSNLSRCCVQMERRTASTASSLFTSLSTAHICIDLRDGWQRYQEVDPYWFEPSAACSHVLHLIVGSSSDQNRAAAELSEDITLLSEPVCAIRSGNKRVFQRRACTVYKETGVRVSATSSVISQPATWTAMQLCSKWCVTTRISALRWGGLETKPKHRWSSVK